MINIVKIISYDKFLRLLISGLTTQAKTGLAMRIRKILIEFHHSPAYDQILGPALSPAGSLPDRMEKGKRCPYFHL